MGRVKAFDSVAVVKAAPTATTVLFTGRVFDVETGLYYFRARYFESELGVFISRDPLGFVDGKSVYQGWFAAHYLIDPYGLRIFFIFYYLNSETDSNRSFNRAAQTRKREIEKNKNDCDKVIMLPYTYKDEFISYFNLLPNMPDAIYKDDTCCDRCIQEISIFGHGDQTGLFFYPKFKGDTDTSFSAPTEMSKLPNKMNFCGDADIVLHSCSSGAWNGDKDLTYYFGSYFGVTVIGEKGGSVFSEEEGHFNRDNWAEPDEDLWLHFYDPNTGNLVPPTIFTPRR